YNVSETARGLLSALLAAAGVAQAVPHLIRTLPTTPGQGAYPLLPRLPSAATRDRVPSGASYCSRDHARSRPRSGVGQGGGALVLALTRMIHLLPRTGEAVFLIFPMSVSPTQIGRGTMQGIRADRLDHPGIVARICPRAFVSRREPERTATRRD